MEQSPNTAAQHREHRAWLSTLNFWQDEIKFFQNQLAETVAHSQPKALAPDVAEKRARMLSFLQRMDDFRHQIHLHEYYTAYFKEQHLREGKVISPSHQEVRQNLAAFMAEYHAFKTEMMAWLKQLAEHTQAS